MQIERDWKGKPVEVFGVPPAIVQCGLCLGQNAYLTLNNKYACWFYLYVTGKIACK